MNRSRGGDDVDEALRDFDEPTQCFVYAGRDGSVRYRVTGRVPIRRTDGEAVPGTRVFDGSAREGEWAGYTPFGESSWEGFIPYAEMPHDDDPAFVGTANQRVVDDADYPYYLAEDYSEPFRGIRLWDRLDALVDRGDVTAADLRDLQRDVHDGRLARFRPVLEAARSGCPATPATTSTPSSTGTAKPSAAPARRCCSSTSSTPTRPGSSRTRSARSTTGATRRTTRPRSGCWRRSATSGSRAAAPSPRRTPSRTPASGSTPRVGAVPRLQPDADRPPVRPVVPQLPALPDRRLGGDAVQRPRR
ncbi:penicillin acylase family protein [Halobaculum litoreum]|uniref:Penicillin acylase family protein n=1 Tax=Halobaculum litoreum TaxID=3031998 RepID=A0ABD5XVV5_9EURY